MKIDIAIFSDTHTRHDEVIMPQCDIALFCGDLSDRGERFQIHDFLEWYSQQHAATFKVMIAGNHDLSFDPIKNNGTIPNWIQEELDTFQNVTYLWDNSVNLMGLKIWGSPVTPDFFPEYWAFNLSRGQVIREHWKTIPNDVDVIMSHGPIHGMLDYVTPSGLRFESVYPSGNVGCLDLKDRIFQLPNLKLFCCGHIHDQTQAVDMPIGDRVVKYVNAACMTNRYRFKHQPILVTLEI